MATNVEDVLLWALGLQGATYVFGAEARPRTKPGKVDCSEAVEFACDSAGVSPKMPDGSWNQRDHCRRHGLLVPIPQAIRTRGALLFMGTPRTHHVVFSLGDGRTMEARGRAYGVGVFTTAGRPWESGGLIPGCLYGRPGGLQPGAKPRGLPTIRPLLKSGMKGEDVRFVQYCLRLVSGKPSSIDGAFGPDTRRAVVDLQKMFGLERDGVVGRKTMAVIVYLVGLKSKKTR